LSISGAYRLTRHDRDNKQARQVRSVSVCHAAADGLSDAKLRLRNQFSEEQLLQLGARIAFENYRGALEPSLRCGE